MDMLYLDDVELARALLAVGGDPVERLDLEAAPQWAQRYARRWLRGIAAELAHELREGCADAIRAATRATEIGTASAHARVGTFRLTVVEHAAGGGTGGGPCTAAAHVSPLDGARRDEGDGDFRQGLASHAYVSLIT